MFLVITTTIVIALDISLSIYMVPIFKYIYKTFWQISTCWTIARKSRRWFRKKL